MRFARYLFLNTVDRTLTKIPIKIFKKFGGSWEFFKKDKILSRLSRVNGISVKICKIWEKVSRHFELHILCRTLFITSTGSQDQQKQKTIIIVAVFFDKTAKKWFSEYEHDAE